MFNNLTTNYAYALVSNQIEVYIKDSVTFVPYDYDGSTTVVQYKDSMGHICVTPEDNFIRGTLDELNAILAEQYLETENIYKSVKASFHELSDLEDRVLKLLVEDGYTNEDIDYDFLSDITRGCKSYLEFNATLLDAYMDYMH